MPFGELDVKETIDREKKNNPEFAEAWDNSRTEYKLLAELVQLRNEKITQGELAQLTENKQQVISRI